jgi:mannosyltransferase OCH1-like enzyme
LNFIFVFVQTTDEMLDKFIKEQYPWFYKTFNSYPFPISKTDAGKYFCCITRINN